MAKRSGPTNAIHRAHANLSKAFDRARMSMADIPLMHEEVDPRTHAKRLAEAKAIDLHLRGIKPIDHKALNVTPNITEPKGTVATQNSRPEPKPNAKPKLRPLPKPDPTRTRKQEGIPGGESAINITTDNYNGVDSMGFGSVGGFQGGLSEP